ncbi:MAG: hypothetical protein FJY83_09290, partial [Candidatus Aminicenantes bacterium]|nr:hypothetical protein [Candidatus Aminicenantes bacterium]
MGGRGLEGPWVRALDALQAPDSRRRRDRRVRALRPHQPAAPGDRKNRRLPRGFLHQAHEEAPRARSQGGRGRGSRSRRLPRHGVPDQHGPLPDLDRPGPPLARRLAHPGEAQSRRRTEPVLRPPGRDDPLPRGERRHEESRVDGAGQEGLAPDDRGRLAQAGRRPGRGRPRVKREGREGRQPMRNSKNKNRTLVTAAAAALLLGFLGPASLNSQGAAQDPARSVDLSFDRFYDHAELTRSLKALERAHPSLLKVKSIGKSYEGRDIWVAVLTSPEGGPVERKPGYYIDGNIHGNEIQGGETALYAVWHLLKNYGKTDLATRLLDERVFYVVPTMNPDSRDYYIHRASDPNSPRSGLVPYDSDRDGLADEDGPDDLDGDGSITQMRKRDPNGTHRAHPEDPRIMIPVKPGEKGEWILLGQEGIDNDGDGLVNEDGPGGYDMNRNY